MASSDFSTLYQMEPAYVAEFSLQSLSPSKPESQELELKHEVRHLTLPFLLRDISRKFLKAQFLSQNVSIFIHVTGHTPVKAFRCELMGFNVQTASSVIYVQCYSPTIH